MTIGSDLNDELAMHVRRINTQTSRINELYAAITSLELICTVQARIIVRMQADAASMDERIEQLEAIVSLKASAAALLDLIDRVERVERLLLGDAPIEQTFFDPNSFDGMG